MNKIVAIQVWCVNRAYYLRAYSQTTQGVSMAGGNPIHVIKAEQTKKLGEEILETLKECKMGILHPDFSQKQPKDEMIKATGMKTTKDLNTQGKAISVYFKEDFMKIALWFFDGKYLTASKDLPDMHCSLDPDDITKTVLLAFDKIDAFQKSH